jgi:hypothetical protein
MSETPTQKTKFDTDGVSSVYFDQYQRDSVDEKAIDAAEVIGDALARHFTPESSMDLGCGGGALVRALVNRGVDAWGVEGSVFGQRLLPLRIHLWDLRAPLAYDRKYELVTCFDVAEHIEEEYADVLVDNVVNNTLPWGFAVFGPAPEGQDGLGHVNCQHPSYWIEKFEARGFGLLSRETNLLRQEVKSDARHAHLWWVAKNLMVFAMIGLSHRGRAFYSPAQWHRSQASQ